MNINRALRRPPRQGHVCRPEGVVLLPEDKGLIASSSNRVIQGMWFGESLSTLETLCMKSFMANGHEFHLYAYEELRGIPQGVVLKDANEIISKDRIKEFRWFAGFSDFFRYSMLALRGGWYVDMDVICLRPFDFPSEYVFAASGCMDYTHGYAQLPLSDKHVYKDSHFVGDAFIKAPKGSALMCYCHQLVDEDTLKGTNDMPYDGLGPRLFKKAVIKFGLEKHVQVPNVFDPVDHTVIHQVIDPTVSWDLRASHAAHLSGSRWEHGSNFGTIGSVGLMPNDRHPDACLYEKLKKKYGVLNG